MFLENDLTSLNLSFNHSLILKSLIEKLLAIAATALFLRVYFCLGRRYYAIDYTLVIQSYAVKSRYWELKRAYNTCFIFTEVRETVFYSLLRFWKIQISLHYYSETVYYPSLL